MRFVKVEQAAEFLERAAPLLLAAEARHNLILGVVGTVRDHPHVYPERRFWLVEEDGTVVGAAARTPPHNLILADANDEAIEALVEATHGIPGVIGNVPEVTRFAERWTARHGGRAEVRFEQGVYEADEIVPPTPPPAGAPRAATTADLPLLLAWWAAFGREALGETESDEAGNLRALEHRLAERGIALWELEGEPVSLGGFGSPTPTGVRIGPVYTPPEHRGRGYASALTAHVSAEQLAAGRSFCFLYTDLANPTSNKIYVELGYRRVCDAVQYLFV